MMEITDQEFYKLVDFVKKEYGINLKEKRTLVAGRLHNILQQKNMESFEEFYDYIVKDHSGEAVTILVNKLTTNHTFFLREPTHFEFFRDKLLPYLAKNIRNHDLRIWSAGCSTGEEPYTLAMIIADYFGPTKGLWDSRILATDLSKRVLDTAKEGVYANEQLASIPEGWRKLYFTKLDPERSRVADKIRNEVIFRSFNLMNPVFPFRQKFQVIFCRNVMIYFDQPTKKALVQRFYEHLEPGGYFFIGHSESLDRSETKFIYIQPSVYRKEL